MNSGSMAMRIKIIIYAAYGKTELRLGKTKLAIRYNGSVKTNSGMLDEKPRRKASERFLVFFARKSRDLARGREMNRAVPGPLR